MATERLHILVGDQRTPVDRFTDLDLYEQWPGGCADGSFFIPASAAGVPVNELAVDASVEGWCNGVRLWRGQVNSVAAVANSDREGWQVELEGLLGRAQHRQDYSAVYFDRDYSQWHGYQPSSKYFSFSNDGHLEVHADIGSYKSGYSYRWWYYLNDGLGLASDTLTNMSFNYDFVLGSLAWTAEVCSKADGPYPDDWTWTGDRLEWSETSGTDAGWISCPLTYPTRSLCFRFKCISDCAINADRFCVLDNLRIMGHDMSSVAPHAVAAHIAEYGCGIDAGKIETEETVLDVNHLVVRPHGSPLDGLIDCADRGGPVHWGFTLDDGFVFRPRAASPSDAETFTCHRGSHGVTVALAAQAEQAADFYGLVYPSSGDTYYPDGTQMIVWYPEAPPAYTDPVHTRVYTVEGLFVTAAQAAVFVEQIATYYSTVQTLGSVTCEPGAMIEAPGGTAIEAWRARPGQWLRQRDSALPVGYITGRRLQQGDHGLACTLEVGESLRDFEMRLSRTVPSPALPRFWR